MNSIDKTFDQAFYFPNQSSGYVPEYTSGLYIFRCYTSTYWQKMKRG